MDLMKKKVLPVRKFILILHIRGKIKARLKKKIITALAPVCCPVP